VYLVRVDYNSRGKADVANLGLWYELNRKKKEGPILSVKYSGKLIMAL
jgi:hypothetical protein